ncbi:hypothetical protein [Dokdonella fugitiva]|uniref:Uncharacterized protein n=1 Tax=Dokdonella fugitiva TaxID=328517 RepID=A0A4V6NND8_9GAMM|nr:hypothetical protein [Dokdonella fugitiva]MBA8883223.1 hypothetical protein [Dokdonella fugitiva]TCO40320.1 hypothetical protein EV148_105115 [Dokdonella fugitiva]
MIDNKAELPVVQKLLDRIVQSAQHIVALQTSSVADTVAQMRVLAMRGGTSIYAWDPDGGLASLRESGMHVPGSKRMSDALRYVLQSMHFGIYLFVDYEPHLKPADVLLLRRISRTPTSNERKLVFVSGRNELPEELDGMYDRLAVESELHRTLRLRDGRWVT